MSALTHQQGIDYLSHRAEEFIAHVPLGAGMIVIKDEYDPIVTVGYANGWAAEFWFNGMAIKTNEDIDGNLHTEEIPAVRVFFVYLQDGKSDPISEENPMKTYTDVDAALHYGVSVVFNRECAMFFGLV